MAINPSFIDCTFWKRMYIRSVCGCVCKDCSQHGSYDSNDLDRLKAEGLLQMIDCVRADLPIETKL